MKVLVTATSFCADELTPALTKLRNFAGKIVFNTTGRPLCEDEIIPLIKDCDGCIAGLDEITEKVLRSCEKLKAVSRYGVGVDHVDLNAAKSLGIKVCNTPGANANAVADMAFALLLSVARKIPMFDRTTKDGLWLRSTGVEIYGKTLGIIGLGAIGKCVAKRARGFSMRVMAYDPYLDENYARAHGIEPASFDRLIEESDVLSLHLPCNDKTRNILNSGVMKNMKRGAIIINTARGGLIDEDAASELLKSGHLGGIGLDAFACEPPENSPLFGLENTVLTPHTASHTAEAVQNMSDMSVQNLIDVLSGMDCKFAVV